MEKINITKDGLEFVNDAGRKVVLRTNHAATSDSYIDLPSSAGTLSTSASGSTASVAEYYDVTLADCENTTALTTVMSFVVPANTWDDGQAIVLDFAFDVLNNTGVNRTAYALLNGTTWTGNDLTGVINSSSSVKRGYVRALAIRSGTGVIMIGKYLNESGNTVVPSNFGDISSMVSSGWLGTSGSYQAYPNDTSVTFDSNITITFKYQWTVAEPDLYFRPRWGSAYKSGKGAAS